MKNCSQPPRVIASILASLVSAQMLAIPEAHSAPTLFPRDKNRLVQVVNTTSSTVLGDHEDLNTVYVKPPGSGTAEPQGFQAFSANVGFCREMGNLQGNSRRLSEMIDRRAREADGMEAEIQEAQKNYQRAKTAAAEMISGSPALKQIGEIQSRIIVIEERLDKVILDLGTCTENCEALNSEQQALMVERRQIQSELSTLRREHRTEANNYQRAQARVEAAKERYEEVEAPYLRTISRLNEARRQVLESYSFFARLAGGFASINYDSRWSQNVETIRAANESSFNVVKIPTGKAQLHFNLVAAGNSRDSYLASLPPILGFSVSGIGFTPGGGPDTNMLPAYPEILSASLNLSLVGACPMLDPDRFDIPKNARGIPAFGITVQYEYPAIMKMKAKFSFNLYKFYEVMKQSGSSGGFFSTHSWSKTSETVINRDQFSVDWFTEDPDGRVSLQERRELENEMRTRLTERVLKMMGEPVPNSGTASLAAPPIPTSGALVIAQGLEQSCGWSSYYCVAGAWVLRAANAIWGGGSTSQTFQQTYDITSTEVWNVDEVIFKPDVTIFSQVARR